MKLFPSREHDRRNDEVLLATLRQRPTIFIRLLAESGPADLQDLARRLENAGADADEIEMVRTWGQGGRA